MVYIILFLLMVDTKKMNKIDFMILFNKNKECIT